MKNLMWHTINDNDGAGHYYYIDGFDLIGKTGTAQIASTNGKGYLTGDRDIIRSVALMFPKDDPEIIIYAAAKRPNSIQALAEPVKEIVKNISKYYNIYQEATKSNGTTYQLNNFINQSIKEVKEILNKEKINTIILGDGNKIINQYPINTTITTFDKVFFVTNSNNLVIPDLTGYSKNDLEVVLTLLKLPYTIKGHGYVINQSILPGTKIDSNMQIEITLANKLKE